jgi:hypothetical protein
MSLLSYRCPETSREVETGIDTDPAALARMRHLKISVACPHCLNGHRIPADQMFFAREPAPAPA